MLILLRAGRVIGTATDDYTGAEEYQAAPDDFDVARMGDYTVADGVVSLPPPPSPNDNIKAQIAAIETKQSRAVREATLTGEMTYLAQLDAQIVALREKLL